MKKRMVFSLTISAVLSVAVLAGCGHKHTFDTSKWASDEKNHYHAADCGHKKKTDVEAHSFGENGRCDVCGTMHAHTFSDQWSMDRTYHWRDPICCTSDVMGDRGVHELEADGVTCKICGNACYALTTEDVTAWLGYPATALNVYFSGPEDQLSYQYDEQMLSIDPAAGTVTALQEGDHTVTVQAGALTSQFTVNCTAIATATWDRFSESYARSLGTAYFDRGTDGKTTVFLGDSFFDVRNYWKGFSQDLAGKDALGFGVASSTAFDWENYLLRDTLLFESAPKNIVMNIGTNDLYDDHMEPENAAAGIQRMFILMHGKMPQTHIYYFSISQRASTKYEDRVNKTNELMQDWCGDLDWITYVDVAGQLTDEDLKDGIHPKNECYQQVFLKALEEAGCVIVNKA